MSSEDLTNQETFGRAATGQNAVINVVVFSQESGEYEVETLELTAEDVTALREDLAGKELSPQLVSEIAATEVDASVPYYSYEDVAGAVMGSFNQALENIQNINNEMRENAGLSVYPVQTPEIDVSNINGIRAAVLGANQMIALTEAEAQPDPEMRDTISGVIAEVGLQELNGLMPLVEEMNTMSFGYDRVPVPGAEYTEPDYEQFREAVPSEPLPSIGMEME